MASAGRILIIPKGNYDSSVTYEMLDMVLHNGTSWLAKKTVVGIEPSEINIEYWHKIIALNAESVGALSRDGYGFYVGNVDELIKAGTYIVNMGFDNVSGTFPMEGNWWFTVVVQSASADGPAIQEWYLATQDDNPIRKFSRHFTGEKWTVYFESANASDGVFENKITCKNEGNLKTIVKKYISDGGVDYGTEITDYDSTGNPAKLCVKSYAQNDNVNYIVGVSVKDGVYYRLFGEHSLELLKSYIEPMIAEYLEKNK